MLLDFAYSELGIIKVGDRVTVHHKQMAEYGILDDEVFNVAEIKYPLMLLENAEHTFYVHVETVQIQKASTLTTEDESEARDD